MIFPNSSYNYPMKYLSRIRTGGPAYCYVEAQTVEELLVSTSSARELGLPFLIIGTGSNILADDDGFRGVIIRLTGGFKFLKYDKLNGIIIAGAGLQLMKLGFSLAREGYCGYSYMAVIPGTVGGAVRMNAGTTQCGEIRDHLVSSLVFNPLNGEVFRHEAKDMCFGYRQSLISGSNLIVLEASFLLSDNEKRDKHQAMQKVHSLTELRRHKHPKNPRTFGSTFRQPATGIPAGWYLQQVGMKGMRIGGAMVSREHSNWIINIGDAKSAEVRSLIYIGQTRVFDEFGVRLEREVVYVPEDMELH